MVQRAKNFWKRPRANGDRPLSIMEMAPSQPPDSGDGDGLRGRRRRTHFVEHMEATREFVGYGPDDRLAVDRTRDLVREHADAVVGTIYDHLLSHPETAMHFAQPSGVAVREQAEIRIDAFRRWLLAVCDGEFDAVTADYLANIGHAHVRPRAVGARPIRARFLFATMSKVQTAVIEVLAREISDPVELGRAAAAWTKLFMIHLDLFLLVYSSTERHARWY